MKTRSALAVFILALLATWPATAAGAEGTVKLVRVPAKFPDRAFVLTLPERVEPRAGLVTVTENGVPVEDIALTPTNALGSPAGTVLVIDASSSMRGEPIANAVTAARTFAGQRRENQALAIVTFNSEVKVRAPVHHGRNANLTGARDRAPTRRRHAHVRCGQARARPREGVRPDVLVDRRPERRQRHRQHGYRRRSSSSRRGDRECGSSRSA